MVVWKNSKQTKTTYDGMIELKGKYRCEGKRGKSYWYARVYFVDITHLSWPLRALRWRKLITCCQDSIRINAGEGFDKNSIVLHSRGMDVSQISHKAITLQKGELQKYGPDYPRARIWKGALSSFGQNVKMQLYALMECLWNVELECLQKWITRGFLLVDTKMK